jgi:hypothetical protein
MLLLSQGCCFIQSLLFNYVLREDSVKFSRIYFGSLSAFRTKWYSVRTLISQQHPSGRPSVYCSIRPDDVSLCPDIRQTSINCPEDVLLPSGHLHRIEKLLCKLAPSGRFSSTSGRLSVLERITDSFQVSRKERSIKRSDDVVSRPDAYLRKARIAVQNEPFGHLTVVVRTLMHRIW